MSFWQFKNLDSKDKDAELLVYGEISEYWGEVDSKSFAEKLKSVTSNNINVRINSPGGEVFAAQAIYSMLKRHTASVTVFIDGIAASAATIIAMAGDRIVMPENAMMMVHNPLTWMYGNANEMRETADLLDQVRETLLAVYRGKTGLDDEKLIELLDAETYLTASEALEYGFIDEIEAGVKIAAAMSRTKMVVNGLSIDPNRFAKMPESWLNKHDSGQTGQQQPKEIKIMDLEKLKAEHPSIYDQIVNEGKQAGVKEERERIQAIEEMSMPGHEALAAQAKFLAPVTAEAFAVQMVKAEKERKQKFLADRQADAEDLEDVGSGGGNADPTETEQQKTEAKRKTLVSSIAAGANAKRGHKK